MADEQARHEEELAQISLQVQRFVDTFTSQLQSSLAVIRLSSSSSASFAPLLPNVVSLDEILPPPPQPKAKRKAPFAASSTTSSSSSSSSSCLPSLSDGCDDSDDGEEVDTDVFGRSIKRRRSKLPLKAVLQLRAWFSRHLQYPYPTDREKEQLAAAARLQPRQVQNCQPCTTLMTAATRSLPPPFCRCLTALTVSAV